MEHAANIAPGFELSYRRLAPRLERIVASRVRASSAVIEESCQIAWGRLVCAQPPVAERSHLSWLTTTATREALRMLRTQQAEHSLQLELGGVLDDGTVSALPAREPGPALVAELREQLAEIHQLPPRQQRMVWLHGLGYGYEEIAAETGDSRRTVERQLLRAKRKLRNHAA